MRLCFVAGWFLSGLVIASTQSTQVAEAELSGGIFSRISSAGPVVFMVLMILIGLSVVSWGIGLAKILFLRKTLGRAEKFVDLFWAQKSLNELNNRMSGIEDSPGKEVFKAGYTELVKGTQTRDQAVELKMGVQAAMDNMMRTLAKTKSLEKAKLEAGLSFLAICASAAPFIGLFGTVWGIMNSFEGIAQSGSSSLAAVAPGISEALIATAFGLGAAIPAVVCYNISVNCIRAIMHQLDMFGSDFLNIVERYLVSDKRSTTSSSGDSHINPPRI
jgi:biopolymer transport protein TolQ